MLTVLPHNEFILVLTDVNYAKCNRHIEKLILYCKYAKYLHETNTIVFTTLSSGIRNFNSIAPLLAKLAYLAMLVILQLTRFAGNVNQLKNK